MKPLFEAPSFAEREMARGTPVYVPVNPIEYHGPHLSLRNDHLVSVGLLRDLHAALGERHGSAPLLQTRDLDVGVDPAPGPGSIPVPFGEVKERVEEACRWLAEHGATRVVLMTFHGSPLHAVALEAGVKLLRRRGVKAFSPLNIVLRELLDLDVGGARLAAAFAGIADPEERAAMIRTLPQDFHGGFFETSMSLHYAPTSVRPIYERLPPCPPFAPQRGARLASRVADALGRKELSRELALMADGLAWYALRPFPGYTGRPHRASVGAGAAFARAIVESYADAAEGVLYGSALSPAPIMRWMPIASLGGRLGPTVPLEAVASPP